MGVTDRGQYLPAAHQNGVASVVNANFSRLADLAYNVKAYGAVGNGVADDTSAIAAAVTAAGATGTVYLPPGTYNTTSTTTLVGSSSGGPMFLGGGQGATHIVYTGAAGTFALNIQSLGVRVGFMKISSSASGVKFDGSVSTQLNQLDHVWVEGPGRGTAGEIGIEHSAGAVNYFNESRACYVNAFETAFHTGAGANANRILDCTTAQYVSALTLDSVENSVLGLFAHGAGGNVTCITIKANRSYNFIQAVCEPGGTSQAIAYETGTNRNHAIIGANTTTIQSDAGSRNTTDTMGDAEIRSFAAVGNLAYSSLVVGDTLRRFGWLADGTLQWSGGSGSVDATLARNAANKLLVTASTGLAVTGPMWPMNTAAQVRSGTGDPEGAVTAAVGSIFLRTDGGAATSLYVKESGSGTTGWVAK